MQVRIVLTVNEMEKPDIRDFIGMIREWELRTPSSDIIGVFFETDPEISTQEAREIFQGIFPEFEHLVEIPATTPTVIRLGSRGVTADGRLVGACEELSLSIGSATAEEVQELENADTICLVRIRKG